MAEKIRVLFACHHGASSSQHADTFRRFLADRGLGHLFSVGNARNFLPEDGFEQRVLNADHIVVTNPALTLDEVKRIVKEARASIRVHVSSSIWHNWRIDGWCVPLLNKIKPDWKEHVKK